ncbi:Glycosyltransferase 25 family member [Amphibalanus amphitrite]|uniref:Glycosyltransferase 25 family member n=1 Tax=Amphibalanus amphitrite TaxID=1232801 RepID=A0A6A4UYT1_AMPAM|nr:glycosyltransferase 25 family member-like [Amphibalanus amphitrite]KAF0289007.1 Glycosyltransferase 25 family member [Amphibalanus amphitrite]
MSQLIPRAVLVMLAVLPILVISHQKKGNEPTVMIVLPVRNKEAYLPYTLSQLSLLDYPKERLSLWVASDHNQDRSAEILLTWLERYGPLYSSVKAAVNTSSPPLRPDEHSAVHMSPGRLRAVADMKQEALQTARQLSIDLIWFLDADVVLHDSTVLRQLLNTRKPLVAPMLRSVGQHSNFCEDVTDDFSCVESERFSEIYSRQQRDCFAVPLIRSCVLVDLRDPRTAGLTFSSDRCGTRPEQETLDDAVTLALSARDAGLQMTVCNQEDFGQLPVPLTPTQEPKDERRNMVNMKLKALLDWGLPPVVPLMRLFLPHLPSKSRLGFDRIYVIGLQRRPERWRRHSACFDELGIEAVHVQAVDGRKLTDDMLEKYNVSTPRNNDWGVRLNKGEIGCFLSHYGVWQDVFDSGLERVLVLENDAHPTAEFPERLQQLVAEADRLRPQWDFIYLFRELPRNDEPVEGAEQLIKPGFCYSAMAYVLSRKGAETLLRDRPLENMLCVDDYIPLMAGNAPHSRWIGRFPSAGTLRTFASRDHLIHPAKVRGERGYNSDTTEVDGVVGARSCAAEGNMDSDCYRPNL